jgi:hypothetical protein
MNTLQLIFIQKKNPGLELAEARWYPTVDQQDSGMGGDQYKVGKTIGLGSVKLWDGNKLELLGPVSKRIARVVKSKDSSFFEMLSEGIPYKDGKVDVLIKVTAISGLREMKVEVHSLNGDLLQFVTGINFHPGLQVEKGENFLVTWGIHPEDVAILPFQVGAAVIFQEIDFEKEIKTNNEYLLISRPVTYLSYKISSTSEYDEKLNTIQGFVSYLKEFKTD